MAVNTPTTQQIVDIAPSYRLAITDEDAADFRHIIADTLISYRRLDELQEPKLPVVVPRTPGYRPDAAENPYNGWYWKTDISGGGTGPLGAKRVANKDNICVAGVPMMNGSQLLEGFVPDIDATPSPARRHARTCASWEPATPARPGRSATRTIRRTARAARPEAVRRWWRPVRFRWRLAATRAAPFVHLRAGVGCTG
jgi:hypothetical protein